MPLPDNYPGGPLGDVGKVRALAGFAVMTIVFSAALGFSFGRVALRPLLVRRGVVAGSGARSDVVTASCEVPPVSPTAGPAPKLAVPNVVVCQSQGPVPVPSSLPTDLDLVPPSVAHHKAVQPASPL